MPNKIAALLAIIASVVVSPTILAQTSMVYRGICNASAAVPLDQDHFAVADDEHNMLQIYRRGLPDPVSGVPLWQFLETDEDKESDLEGSAVVGSRIYWISSHGTNKKGKVQDRRRRFFATDIVGGSPPTVTQVGKPYNLLIEDLSNLPSLSKYKLAKAAKRPPKSPGGLSIEGLAATVDGGLLIGFRNPVPRGKALIVPLQNPDAVVRGSRASFGPPIEIDLKGQGIRSIERDGESYLIVAGEISGGGLSKLYKWSGRISDDPTPIDTIDFSGFNPEALFVVPNRAELQILSDDGKVDGDKCSDLKFRSMIVAK
jgi:hypothetical protein